jgi:4-hydroxyphenylacetaldehyde oxime monooxygenase
MEGFNPERFKAGASYGEVDLHGAHFELLPFSAGRRICPGIAMALMNLEFTLANLL